MFRILAEVVAGASRYLIILFALIYICFDAVAIFKDIRSFGGGTTADGKTSSIQTACLIAIWFVSCVTIYASARDGWIMAFGVFMLVFFACFVLLYRRFCPLMPRRLINDICMLILSGLVILARLSHYMASRQLIIAAVSAAVCLLIPVLAKKLKGFRILPCLCGLLGLASLAAVLVAGSTSYGARLAFSFGSFSLQPSEFVKISFVFFLAALLCRAEGPRSFLPACAAAAAHVLMLVLSRDLGGALIFFTVYIMMAYIATSKSRYLWGGLLCGGAAAAAAFRLFAHVRRRVMAWADPWADIDDVGYQAAQALFAIGSGGFLGSGLCKGMPQTIPVVEKDFIFAAICEEMGAVYAICLLFACLSLIWQVMAAAVRIRDKFRKLAVFGLGAVYAVQVFLAVGGTVKFIPSTGVTLPFVSYGGSSLLATFMLFAAVGEMAFTDGRGAGDGALEIGESGGTGTENSGASGKGDPVIGENRGIMKFAAAVALLFLGICLYMSYFIAWGGREVLSNPYNLRI